VARLGRRAVVLLGLWLLSPCCSSTSSAERVGIDQEISRNILWRFHGDARFSNVRVLCEDRVIVLEGRVDDPGAAAEAVQIARSESRGGKVESRLEVRLR
jgi:osmotically-inducible protein OsmY